MCHVFSRSREKNVTHDCVACECFRRLMTVVSVAHRGTAAKNYFQLTKQNRSLVSNWFGKC